MLLYASFSDAAFEKTPYWATFGKNGITRRDKTHNNKARSQHTNETELNSSSRTEVRELQCEQLHWNNWSRTNRSGFAAANQAVTQTHVTYKRVTGSTCCRSIQVSSVQFMRCKQTFNLLYDSVPGTGVDLFEVWTRNYWIIVITNWMTSQLIASK